MKARRLSGGPRGAGRPTGSRPHEAGPDLVILDLTLPGLDGLSLCRMLRRDSDVPVIVLTARGAEIDRITGLETGADDYVVKPFSLGELLARVRANLRRPRPTAEDRLELDHQITQQAALNQELEQSASTGATCTSTRRPPPKGERAHGSCWAAR